MTRPVTKNNKGSKKGSYSRERRRPRIFGGSYFIAGVLLHPFLIRTSERFLSPMQEVFLLLMALGLTLLMFLITKSHLVCSLLQTGGLILNVAVFAYENLDDGWEALLKNMDYEWWFRIILMWCAGAAVTILIRLFSHKKWNAAHIRKTFSSGFLCSSIVFFLLYILLLLDLFIFQRSTAEVRTSMNLIPFKGAFSIYWPQIKSGHFRSGVFVQFFGNLLIFTPLGFYLDLWWRKKPHKWILYLIPVVLASAIELCQYYFRIGQCDIDDMWMNVVGFVLGILLVKILDMLRFRITKGKEKKIFKF